MIELFKWKFCLRRIKKKTARLYTVNICWQTRKIAWKSFPSYDHYYYNNIKQIRQRSRPGENDSTSKVEGKISRNDETWCVLFGQWIFNRFPGKRFKPRVRDFNLGLRDFVDCVSIWLNNFLIGAELFFSVVVVFSFSRSVFFCSVFWLCYGDHLCMNSTLAVCVLLWQLSEGELSQCDGQITFHMMKGCKMGNSFLLCCYEQITDEGFFIISFSNTSHLQLNPPKLTFRHILAIILYQVHFKLQHTNHLQGIMSSIVLSTSHFPLIFSRIHRETT